MFPLLRLDRVSLDEVLRNLNPIQLFNLSLCSKITSLNVKCLTQRINKKIVPMISISAVCSVYVYCYQQDNTTIPWSFVVYGTEQLGFRNRNQFIERINGIGFVGAIFEDGKKMKTYWENEDLGFKALIEHIEDLYGKCAELNFNGGTSEKLIRMIDWGNDRQKPIDSADINLNSINSDNEISDILDALKVCKKLQLSMTPSQEFIRNDQRTYKFKYVVFKGGNYFNLQRLLSMECRKFIAYNTSLTNGDIKLFIKQWIQGWHQEFKYLQLKANNLSVPLILSDMPHSKTGPVTFDGLEVSMAFDIKRSDGKIARILELSPDLITKRNKNLNFVMWVRR